VNIWGKILYKGFSPYNGEIKVIEYRDQRRLLASGFAQSRTLGKDGKSEFYWDSFIEELPALKPNAKVLILGLGAGTSALQLRKRYPEVEIDGVEIDPLIIELAKKYFDLDQAQVKIIQADAKNFVMETRLQYDVIFVDVFNGGEVPSFVLKADFFEKLKTTLSREGAVVLNKIYESREEAGSVKDFFEKYFKLIQETHSPGWKVPGNLILIGKHYG
jgi:spermidine synthase